METLGRYLIAHREKAGVKLETIAYQTKVRLSLLQDLEADKLDKLPQGVFLRGYVRAYTDALHLRSDRALELLDHAFEPIVSIDSPTETRFSEAPAPTTAAKLRWAALAVGLLMLGLAGAWWLGDAPESQFNSVSSSEKTDVDLGTTKALTPLTPDQGE